MYAQHPTAAMAPPQKPETFMLSNEAQQSLPQDAQVALQQVDNLKYFLISAPVDWSPDQYLRRFLLPTGEYVSCVLWNNLFHISGTDIVRCLSFRFQAFGRPVKNSKKFEEGIFSDLRNLKSGTDASLEEPKSAFLDFLYKNNCIRTQKKQKVFYWYSVPHDRLFLDALERDLKREKMNQEPTTIAVSEPALSFEFDSSQSLFEQLTKAQQANTSSFSAHAGTPFSQSTSPIMRAVDSMPPPQMMPPPPSHPSLPTVAEEETVGVGMGGGVGVGVGSQVAHHHPHHHHHHHHQHHPSRPHHHQYPGGVPAYPTHPHHAHHGSMSASLPPAVAHGGPVKGEPDFGQPLYDRSMVPVGATGRPQPRHASMPTYLEYSPAPSFVSSGYDDYTNRAISYEPLTPPQPAIPFGPEPAYIAHEDPGLYAAIPDVTSAHAMGGVSQLPPAHFGGALYPSSSTTSAAAVPMSAARVYGGPNHVYHVIEGSPTYKQRRRRSSISSISAGVAAAAAAAAAGTSTSSSGGHHASHRPSELRRSVSDSVPPVPEDDETAVAHEMSPPAPPAPPPAGATSTPGPSLTNAYALHGPTHAELLDLSRHGTPLPTLEGSPSMGPHASASSAAAATASAVMPPPDEFGALPASMERVHESPTPGQAGLDPRAPPPPGVLRRARSATVMELGPYPQKSHSCPIPTCGRLFKRLEHLKRHVRTHTQERPYRCPFCNKAFSRSDNLAQHRKTHEREDGTTDAPGLYNSEEDVEGEDGMGAGLDEGSPADVGAIVDTRDLTGLSTSMTSMPMGSMPVVGLAPSQLINSHHHHALLPQAI